MKYLEILNQNQRQAAEWNNGPLLVLAGPGSGKTATLTARVARLIEQSHGESFRILCLTFTRKAAAEMRERLLKLVPDSRERVILTTFHSFATDILRQHGSHFGLSPDFEILEEIERVSIIKSILSRSSGFTQFISSEKILPAIDFLLRNGIPDDDIPNLVKNEKVGSQLQELFIQYKTFLKEQNCLDYGTILYFCEELLRERPRISKQLRIVYKYICVDEFQDTNVAQYRMLRAIAPDKDANIFIVGDDDQVIYQWNGASPNRVKELNEHYNLSIIQLPENYRCPSEVVTLANALITHNIDRSLSKKPLLSMKKHSGNNPVALLPFDDEQQETSEVAKNIKAKLDNNVLPSDIVILARTTKLLEQAEKALNNLSITSHVQRRKSQFESVPIRFIVSALKLALVRSDEELVTIFAKSFSDCMEQDIHAEELTKFAVSFNGDYLEALGALVNNNFMLPNEIRQAIVSLVEGKYSLFIQQSFSYFDDIENKENKENNGNEHYAEYCSERTVWRSIIRDIGGEDEAYSLSLGQFLQELALANKTPDAPSNAVRCLTIHSSKGLEFKHVYLIGMAEDQLPSFQSKKLGDNSREMQEERRNCFVAITRAVETLTLSYAKKYNGWKKEPSRFLFEMGLLAPEHSASE